MKFILLFIVFCDYCLFENIRIAWKSEKKAIFFYFPQNVEYRMGVSCKYSLLQAESLMSDGTTIREDFTRTGLVLKVTGGDGRRREESSIGELY